ncbi:glycosyltransferase family A protein [Jannaschia seohaensis]|uniref:Glycosyl transferase family 2 n=1 Tax=Jannaschia seohaensis TaxID=475081 RepID=A0A2Y9B5M6_9RHOB|nr:glycosyltransferase family A protein [Jannaschia seohaensis]PWJ10341.1 hypothetical protein BCF38_12420 [Jannaschia seohaensis]SSA51741.1 hypothetical protein SAMN05421539_12420 [Jannaschia seohaensis]
MDDLEIFVFSYDRGAHLAWCLDSLARHAPGVPVTVMDDRSADPRVAEALVGRDVTVWRPEARAGARLGGLYANMQAAFDRCEARWAMFVQDDCQTIRPLDAGVRADLEAVFADPAQMVATPLIAMGPRQGRRAGQFRPVAGGAAFHFVPPGGRGSPTAQYFYALSVLDVPRLRAAGWRFARSEAECARALQALGAAPMAHMARPWLAQLPEVPTSRFGRRTLGAALAERLDGPEVRGFRDLPGQVEGDGTRPPVAEDVLQPTHPSTTRPFVHKGVNRRLWTRALNKLEMRLRR